MSPRTLSRWCREHLGESPAELVRRLRLDEARRLLEETSLPLKDITARTGLGDAEHDVARLHPAPRRHAGRLSPALRRARYGRVMVTPTRRSAPGGTVTRRSPMAPVSTQTNRR